MSHPSLPVLDAAGVEALTRGLIARVPEALTREQTLLALAASGELKGIVTKPARYSATTVQWYVDCPRKFYWPALTALEDPPSQAQEFGTRLHKYAEEWLRNGTPPPQDPAGVLLGRGLVHLPQPKTKGLMIEQPFEQRFDGVPVLVTGTLDFARAPLEDGPVEEATSFLLGDHKSARSIRWPKTKEWLATNVQSNLYAKVLFDHFASAGFTALRTVKKKWVYYYKDEVRAEPLQVVDSREHVEHQFETAIKPTLIAMARMVAEAPRIADVPSADKSVCEMYNGCAHYRRCWGKDFVKGPTKGFADAKPNKESSVGVLSGSFSKSNLAAKAQTPQVQQLVAGGPRAAAFAPPTVVGPRGAGSAINPPRPQPAPAAIAQEPAFDEGDGADSFEAGQVEQQQQQEVPSTLAPSTRKPRARKETPAPAASQQEQAAAPAPTLQQTNSPRAPGYHAGHSFWLYYGCRPVSGSLVSKIIEIEKLVGPAMADAAASLNTGHYRAGSGSYGVLEAAFAAFMESKPIVGCVVVPSGWIAARDVIGLLRAHATEICEGMIV